MSMSYDNYIVYVLVLEEGRFYVGITKELARRYAEHRSGIGSAYTKRYKPLAIVYKKNTNTFRKTEAERLEHSTTIALMKKYGIDSVRGAEYCQINTKLIKNQMGDAMVNSIETAYRKKRMEHSFGEIDKNLCGLLDNTREIDTNGNIVSVANKQTNKKKRKKKKSKAEFWWEKRND